jgi:AcrR family transcriptional regulator
MPPDSSATKARILEAAFREFATFGLAGARIDRIAETARANKRAIYAYFGNKETLFDIVLADQLTMGAAAVPHTRGDLSGYAGDLVDFYAADPDRARLAAWRRLERPAADAAQVAVYRDRLDTLRADPPANDRNPDELDPVDLLAIVAAIATSWVYADSDVRESASDPAGSSRRLAAHRSAVVESVRRVMAEAPLTAATSPAGKARKVERPDPPMDSLF